MKKHVTAEQFQSISLFYSNSIKSIPCWFYWGAYPITDITPQLNIARCCMGEREIKGDVQKEEDNVAKSNWEKLY